MTPEQNYAAAKDQHDFLVALLKESRYGLVDFGFKSSAVIFLLIGWVVSSETAQHFFIQTQCARPIGTVGLIVYFGFFAYWTLTYRARSVAAYKHLVQLRFLNGEFYRPFLITERLVASFWIVQGLCCATLIAYLWLIKEVAKKGCA